MHAKAVNVGKINKKNTTKKIAIIRQKTKLNPKSPVESPFCRTRHRGDLKIILDYGKRIVFWHLVLLEKRSCLRSRRLVLWLLGTLTGQQRFYGTGLVT